jgi:hypothetical protein
MVKKETSIQAQEVSKTPDKISPWHTMVNTLSTENKERIMKAAKKKHQITYKGKPISRFFIRNLKMKKGME